jgi:hypothetical protein
MRAPVTLARLKPGNTVALINILGRKLATVTKVSRKGFAVGRAKFRLDGRGFNHSNYVAVLPDEVELLEHGRAERELRSA